GPDHPDVANSLNDLAELYKEEDRIDEALLMARAAAQKQFVRKQLYLNILTEAVAKSLVLKPEAIYEGYKLVQQATSSAASSAINQLSVRFAAGRDELAQLIRRDQDLSAESDNLDKVLIAEISKEPRKRVRAKEQQIRGHLESIATERSEIQASFRQR